MDPTPLPPFADILTLPADAWQAKRRFEWLLELVNLQVPGLWAPLGGLPLAKLSMVDWQRDPRTWRGDRKTESLERLMEHLLAHYPLPNFARAVFLSPGIVQVMIRLVAEIGRGGSVFRAAKREGLALSRRGCHLFANTPPGFDGVQAYRRAQALSQGADEARAQWFVASALGREIRDDEPFWSRVIHWMVARPDLTGNAVDPLLDYIASRRAENDDYELAGRTLQSVRRDMLAWHAHLAAHADRSLKKFPSAGLGTAWVGKDEPDVPVWCFSEIRTPSALADEGARMRHCVASYRWKIERERVAIVGVRGLLPDGTEAMLTLEICLRRRAVVQSRGKFNRRPNEVERDAITTWAQKKGLRVLG